MKLTKDITLAFTLLTAALTGCTPETSTENNEQAQGRSIAADNIIAARSVSQEDRSTTQAEKNAALQAKLALWAQEIRQREGFKPEPIQGFNANTTAQTASSTDRLNTRTRTTRSSTESSAQARTRVSNNQTTSDVQTSVGNVTNSQSSSTPNSTLSIEQSAPDSNASAQASTSSSASAAPKVITTKEVASTVSPQDLTSRLNSTPNPQPSAVVEESSIASVSTEADRPEIVETPEVIETPEVVEIQASEPEQAPTIAEVAPQIEDNLELPATQVEELPSSGIATDTSKVSVSSDNTQPEVQAEPEIDNIAEEEVDFTEEAILVEEPIEEPIAEVIPVQLPVQTTEVIADDNIPSSGVATDTSTVDIADTELAQLDNVAEEITEEALVNVQNARSLQPAASTPTNFVTWRQSSLPNVQFSGGRYLATLTDNSNNKTLHFNQSQGRFDGALVTFPFEVVVRNIGIGQVGNPQSAPSGGPNHFNFAGVQVHSLDSNAKDSVHVVVGHRGATSLTVEGKSTVNGVSKVNDAGNGAAPSGRADIRIVGNADRSISVYWQQPNPNPGSLSDNWTAYNGNGRLPGPQPSFAESAYIGLITYAFGNDGVPFVGTADSFEVND